MRRSVQYLFGTFIAALLVAGPIGYAWYWQRQIRNLRVVRDGVLYRSGQMSLAGLKSVVHDYGIRTVISLRDGTHPGEPPPDSEEEDYCWAQELTYCRITPQDWDSRLGTAPAEEGVRKFRAIMDDPDNYPVLIHCWAGIHRTGAFCAIYRMEYEHWTNEAAMAEMRDCGYTNLDNELDILGYLEQYRPRWQAATDPAGPATSQQPHLHLTSHKKHRRHTNPGPDAGADRK
ncbi:MAG TPA: tyrosine-protein phosphatase [Gemmataceae bacterium]|jgi:protein tyrosine phosphatase (PTP) superfamily phosphohydrolase (DUF442 family)|nr:tyrosine-protein phosphatase [Gemmataceae bacterium]